MFANSTNVFQDQASGSEESVHAGLLAQVAGAKGRVLVTTFASNAARLQTIGRVANETGRRVCIAGRSLDRILRVAQSTGYLHRFPAAGELRRSDAAAAREVLIIATGGQGEPRAALGRIASGTHELKLTDGDTVIFSSLSDPRQRTRHRPDHEPAAGLGVTMVTDARPMFTSPVTRVGPNWCRCTIGSGPRSSSRSTASPALAEHARLALHGVPKAMVQKNGDVIRLAPDGPKKIDEVRVGQLVLDGDVILPADGATINERRRIGYSGLITVAVAVDGKGQLAGPPLIRPFGVPVEEDRDDFIADATDAASRAYSPGGDKPARAKPSAWPSAAARHCGRARNRWWT